jgi:outer membrane protein
MIKHRAGRRGVHPRRTSPVEIRLVVMVVVVALLALLPMVAGAQEVASQRVRVSLGEAVDRALRGSEVVEVAEAGLLRARGDRYQARSGFLPKVGGTVGYTRTLSSEFEALRGAPADSGSSPFDGLGDLPFGQAHRYDIGLQAAQTVFAGGRIIARSRVAEAGVRSAQVGVASARAELELDVTEAYYGAVLSERLVTIAEASLAQAEATLAQVRASEGVGESAEFDVLRAQVARDNQRPQVIQRRAERELAHMRLKQLLKVPMEATLELTTALSVRDLLAVSNGSGGAAHAVVIDADTASADRAAVRQAAELVTVRENLRRATQAERLPSIALTTQWGRVGYPKQGLPAWDELRSNWTVGVQMELPILTGGAQRGAELMAQADVAEARARLEQTRELAALDARSALERLASAESAWEASVGTVEQAERAYRIAEIRFREGLSTQVELSDGRLMLQQAEMNRAVAARDVEVARTVLRLMPDLPLGR